MNDRSGGSLLYDDEEQRLVKEMSVTQLRDTKRYWEKECASGDPDACATSNWVNNIIRRKLIEDLEPNAGMKNVKRAFNEAFDRIDAMFPDLGTIELHEDKRAGADNGSGADRQFAYCMEGDPIVIAFAPKARDLPLSRLRGLMRHELGHALEYRYGVKELQRRLGRRLPEGVERRADVIAEAVWGQPLRYDDNDVQCVGVKGKKKRPAYLTDKKETLKANPSSRGYQFDRSCPQGPVWWIEWVTDPDVSGHDDSVPWEEIEGDLAGDGSFVGFMGDWVVHPRDDHHVDYYRTTSPSGVPLIVIQHSGIENIWAQGPLDLEKEERLAEGSGFWYLANNPASSMGDTKVTATPAGEVTIDWYPGIAGYGGIVDQGNPVAAMPGIGAWLNGSFLANDLQVEYIEVDVRFREEGVATRLYEEALALARERGGTLISDSRLAAGAEGFWDKMEKAGLAEKMHEGPVSYFVMRPEAKVLPNPVPKLTAYHGAHVPMSQPTAFRDFRNMDFGPGFYLSTSPDDAREYGAHVYRAEVDLKNPVMVTDDYDPVLLKWFQDRLRIRDENMQFYDNPMVAVLDLMKQLSDSGQLNPKAIVSELQVKGYDGIFIDRKVVSDHHDDTAPSGHYVAVWSPDQITTWDVAEREVKPNPPRPQQLPQNLPDWARPNKSRLKELHDKAKGDGPKDWLDCLSDREIEEAMFGFSSLRGTVTIDTGDIEWNDDNEGSYDDVMEEVDDEGADSFDVNTPIIVDLLWDGSFELNDGHHRYVVNREFEGDYPMKAEVQIPAGLAREWARKLIASATGAGARVSSSSLTISDLEAEAGKAHTWEGKCDLLAHTAAALTGGRPVYGHWLGGVNKTGYWADYVTRPFIRHGWVELSDGRVLDPTRWSFEGADPYVWVGENDGNYDEGGERFYSLMRMPPPGNDADSKQMPLGVSPRCAEYLNDILGRDNEPTASPRQMMWLANVDPKTLGDCASELHRSLEDAGLGGFIPVDYAQAVKSR
ncbi:MAG: hypothetical protein DRH30_13500 [Deltaproteobacteria bacterium]|nr:MAG: hypothetical protein DRH30_13500 [Deltaproteobacteria bacterium]